MKTSLKNAYYSSSTDKIGTFQDGGTTIKGEMYKLDTSMIDSAITKKWNIEPISIPDFWATVENMIETLDKSVWGYIFYVKASDGRSLAVGVHWFDKQWKFYCFEFGEGGEWIAERCVFAPATAAETSRPSLTPGLSNPLSLDQAIAICKAAGLKVIRIETKEVEL